MAQLQAEPYSYLYCKKYMLCSTDSYCFLHNYHNSMRRDKVVRNLITQLFS
jgi:hypothetical protein